MNPQKQELLDKLKGANNILVTVSADPSVDQLAACIGVTLLLNKLKKHATAVFSGQVPSTIEFLKPEATLEKTTDSLRDFIISLDKNKADKLRYKVEDQVVRIFITPYRTSIGPDDLDFDQGDFNVDVVLCLGISRQQDVDQAITAHGRILHDAVVTSINLQPGGELGSVNWTEPGASSLSELVTELADALGQGLLDSQISTALLTGIVAETERFSNEKTSPETMRLSAELMAAGANQQLVATELETPLPVSEAEFAAPTAAAVNDEPPSDVKVNQDGSLEITHPDVPQEPIFELPEPSPQPDAELPADEQPPAEPLSSPTPEQPAGDALEPPLPDIPEPASRMILQPPVLGGTLTANSSQLSEDGAQDPLNGALPSETPLLDHAEPIGEFTSDAAPETPAPVAPQPVADTAPIESVAPEVPQDVAPALLFPELPGAPQSNDNDAAPVIAPTPVMPFAPDTTAEPVPDAGAGTLADIEQSVNSPHLDAARDAVETALSTGPATGLPKPNESSGASGYLNVHDLDGVSEGLPGPVPRPAPDLTEAAANSPTTPPSLGSSSSPAPSSVVAPIVPATDSDQSAPPPVPPPLPLDNLSRYTAPGS